jgi:hypothetical protein
LPPHYEAINGVCVLKSECEEREVIGSDNCGAGCVVSEDGLMCVKPRNENDIQKASSTFPWWILFIVGVCFFGFIVIDYFVFCCCYSLWIVDNNDDDDNNNSNKK